MSQSIEVLIKKDMEIFVSMLAEREELNSESIITLSAHIAAQFMRIIYTKQKTIAIEEVNGVLGIISNILHEWFEDQITTEDYEKISKRSLDFLKDTDFDEKSRIYFSNLVQK